MQPYTQRNRKQRKKPFICIFPDEPPQMSKVNRSLSPFHMRRRPPMPTLTPAQKRPSTLQSFMIQNQKKPTKHTRNHTSGNIGKYAGNQYQQRSRAQNSEFQPYRAPKFEKERKYRTQTNFYDSRQNTSPNIQRPQQLPSHASQHNANRGNGYNTYRGNTSMLSRIPQCNSRSDSGISSLLISRDNSRKSSIRELKNLGSRRSFVPFSKRELENDLRNHSKKSPSMISNNNNQGKPYSIVNRSKSIANASSRYIDRLSREISLISNNSSNSGNVSGNGRQVRAQRPSRFISEENMDMIKSRSFVQQRPQKNQQNYATNRDTANNFENSKMLQRYQTLPTPDNHSQNFGGYPINNYNYKTKNPLNVNISINQNKERNPSQNINRNLDNRTEQNKNLPNFERNQNNRNWISRNPSSKNVVTRSNIEQPSKLQRNIMGTQHIRADPQIRDLNLMNKEALKSLNELVTRGRNNSLISRYSNLSNNTLMTQDQDVSLGFKVQRRMKTPDRRKFRKDLRKWRRETHKAPFDHLKNQSRTDWNGEKSRVSGVSYNLSGILSKNRSQISDKYTKSSMNNAVYKRDLSEVYLGRNKKNHDHSKQNGEFLTKNLKDHYRTHQTRPSRKNVSNIENTNLQNNFVPNQRNMIAPNMNAQKQTYNYLQNNRTEQMANENNNNDQRPERHKSRVPKLRETDIFPGLTRRSKSITPKAESTVKNNFEFPLLPAKNSKPNSKILKEDIKRKKDLGEKSSLQKKESKIKKEIEKQEQKPELFTVVVNNLESQNIEIKKVEKSQDEGKFVKYEKEEKKMNKIKKPKRKKRSTQNSKNFRYAANPVRIKFYIVL